MMRKGGYKIIDLHDTQFTSGVPMMLEGIHDAIKIESTDAVTVTKNF